MKVKNIICECGCEELELGKPIKPFEETILVCKQCGKEINNEELKEQFNKNMGVICE